MRVRHLERDDEPSDRDAGLEIPRGHIDLSISLDEYY